MKNTILRSFKKIDSTFKPMNEMTPIPRGNLAEAIENMFEKSEITNCIYNWEFNFNSTISF